MKRLNSKCQTCKGQKARKKAPPKPYGTTGTNQYCHKCDMDYTYNVSKSSIRRKVKKEIDANLKNK